LTDSEPWEDDARTLEALWSLGAFEIEEGERE
jgi:hypothetical protein